ncbi:TIGR02646 family protein [Pseudomonas capsici]|uniref:retron system putative HNH endonuclease n=1 Tax=Pseudomonas capsici TaxID=2810614 RepID=UPI001C8AEA36|nr:retron system putative HNH endonuclease [Pseudomonas capsici]MBX8475046.1 TIGR02646 family protein [Pseudomonas cichorii]MCV4262162.1 TIGR02646 family protein [Pseudomonas capsici]MCV4287653.1 TIGR02646 family protein [Pseudomonas capsici]
MKRVVKGTEPASFTQWKASANEDWTPTYPTLQNPQKRDLHNSLLKEQNFFCCYCGREINLDSSHIEHFRPQEDYDTLALEYENLHASCLRETKPGNPLHCGHHKSNWFDETLHISPTDNNCEQRFRYLLTGVIQKAQDTDAAAAMMIEKLALDIAYLNQRRQSAIRKVFDDQFIADVSDKELQDIVNGLRSATHDKQIAFDHVVARYAEQLLL